MTTKKLKSLSISLENGQSSLWFFSGGTKYSSVSFLYLIGQTNKNSFYFEKNAYFTFYNFSYTMFYTYC